MITSFARWQPSEFLDSGDFTQNAQGSLTQRRGGERRRRRGGLCERWLVSVKCTHVEICYRNAECRRFASVLLLFQVPLYFRMKTIHLFIDFSNLS